MRRLRHLSGQHRTASTNRLLGGILAFNAGAINAGVPAPGFSSALAYYDQLRAPRVNAAMTQGLRDYFGAHTYRRVDRDGSFHVNWSTDGSEEQTA